MPAAFRVWSAFEDERSRFWALEDGASRIQAMDQDRRRAGSNISNLQLRLMQTNLAVEREQLPEDLVEYERRLGLA